MRELGAGVRLPHSEIHPKSDPHRTYEYQYNCPAARRPFGSRVPSPRTGSVFIEYKFTTADYWGPLTGTATERAADIIGGSSRWWSGEPPPNGWAGANFTSHQSLAASSGGSCRGLPAPRSSNHGHTPRLYF